MKYHRGYWGEHVRVGWTCPYCNSNHVSNEHKKKHWATHRCRKIQEQKGIVITETIQGKLESVIILNENDKIIKFVLQIY
jgi:peroxiredoxin